MLRGLFVLYVLVIFFLGFTTHAALNLIEPAIANQPVPMDTVTLVSERVDLGRPVLVPPAEKQSPYDWIQEKNIHLYSDKIVIDIKNPQWSTYTDTNSMDPVLDENTHGIQIIPQSTQDIHLGDIISYKPENFDGILIHRVAAIGRDDTGWYAITQGDNNPTPDPGKVRFNQIKRILVMIIY